jgi:hypothetical protein
VKRYLFDLCSGLSFLLFSYLATTWGYPYLLAVWFWLKGRNVDVHVHDSAPNVTPFMPLLLGASAVLPLLWLVRSLVRWKRQKLRDGHCVRCGYDLRASTDRCPECGTPTRPSS